MARKQKSKATRQPSRAGRSKEVPGRSEPPLGQAEPVVRHNSSRRAEAAAGGKRIAGGGPRGGRTVSEEPNHFFAEESEAEPRQRKRRRKQVRLSVAMRKIGLDEYMVAERLAGLIEKLGTSESQAKLLLDALKESTRFLEPAKAVGANEGEERPCVTLRHEVPRPARDGLQEQSGTELDGPEAQ